MNTENNSENKPSLIIFLDSIGRLILGEKEESTDDNIFNVKNPVVIMINGDQTGKMSVQLFPLFFREFLADKSRGFRKSISVVKPTRVFSKSTTGKHPNLLLIIMSIAALMLKLGVAEMGSIIESLTIKLLLPDKMPFIISL